MAATGNRPRTGNGWNSWRNEAGLSLVEMLLTLTLLLVVVAAFLLFQSQGILLYTRGKSHADLEYSLRTGLDRVERELRAAKNLSISGDGSSITYTDVNGERAVLYVAPTTRELQRSVAGGLPQVFATEITSLHFAMAAGRSPLVFVSLTAAKGDLQRDASSLVAVRAP